MKKITTLICMLLVLSVYLHANSWDFKTGTDGWGSYGPDMAVAHDGSDNIIVTYDNSDANFDYPALTIDLSSAPLDVALVDSFFMKYTTANWPADYGTVLMNIQFETDQGAKHAPVNFTAADGLIKIDLREGLAADWGILPESGASISRIRIELPHSSAAGQANFSKWENAGITIDYIFFGEAMPETPTAAFSADVLTGAAPLTVEFTDESENSPTSWAWDFDNDGVTDATEQNPSHIFAEAGTYTVKLTTTNIAGSDESIRIDYIEVTASEEPVTMWDFKTGTDGWGSYGPDMAVAHDGSDNIIVTYDNSDANFDYPALTIDLSSAPLDVAHVDSFFMKYETANWPAEYETVLMNVQFETDQGAKNAPVNFIASDGFIKFDIRDNALYDWGILPEDGASITRIRIELPHNSAAGQANFSKWENAQITIDYISVRQAPLLAPIAAFSADILTGAAPLSVQFTDESENMPVSWAWDFDNDGIIDATEQNPSYTYSAEGTYSVKLTATNAIGSDESILSDYIEVTPAEPIIPIWDFKTGVENWTSYGPDLTIAHDGSDNIIVNYNNDDANFDYPALTIDLSVAPIDVSLLDTFYMKYEATNWPAEYETVLMNIQFETDQGAKYVPVNFTASDGAIMFDIRKDAMYDWGILPEDGASINRIRIELPHNSAAGQGNFSKWGNAQLTIDYIAFGQAPPFAPRAIFSADLLTGAAPLTIQFTDESEDFPSTWAWDFDNDGVVDATDQNPSYTYTDAGNFTVKLFVTNTNGSDENIQADYIEVTAGLPVAAFSADITSGDAPLAVQFTDESENTPTSWAWDFDNDGVVDATDQNPAFTYTEPGTYSVKLVVTNDGGSDESNRNDYIEVTAALPVAAFSADITSGDAPLAVQFTDESENTPTSWAWDFDNDGVTDATDQNPAFTYTEPGTYSVKLTVSNAGGSDETVSDNYIEVSEAVSVKPGVKNIIQIVPNPTRGRITINGEWEMIKIYSITGQMVKQINDNGVTEDISDLPGGVYFIKLLNDNRSIGQIKLIKE